MKLESLDRNNPLPLYRQLYSQLATQINAGVLQAGDRLPSERELSERLRISRITSRQAMDALVDDGLVYREQGRGTFVAESKKRGLLGFASFTEDMISRGLKPSSRVITQELEEVEGELQQDLRLNPGERAIHLVRVRIVDGIPIAVQSAYLPHKLFPGLENEDFATHSLYEIIREKYYVYPKWTEAEMEALSATKEHAELLEIDKGDPTLIVRGISFTESFDVVECVETIYRGKGLAIYIGRQRISSLG